MRLSKNLKSKSVNLKLKKDLCRKSDQHRAVAQISLADKKTQHKNNLNVKKMLNLSTM